MNNASYCVLAWKHLAIEPNGHLRPCCISQSTVTKPDGTPYNIGYDNIEDIVNSEYYLNLRAKMIKGEKEPGCYRCYLQEERGGTSVRLMYNSYFSTRYPIRVDLKNVNYLDIRFGNLCNLKCRSCNPVNSSQFDKELKDMNGLAREFHEPLDSDINIWYTTDKFKENIKILEQNVKLIYMTGGEPTLVEGNYELMESIIAQDRNKEVSLKFSTNLTKVTDRFLKLITQFKSVYILGSVEGVGAVQEYLRTPSNWAMIDKNIKKLLKVENVSVTITPTLQNSNLESVSDVINYVEDINKSYGYKKVDIFPMILDLPDYLHLKDLPLDYKKRCWDILENCLNNLQFDYPELLVRAKQIKFLCYQETDYTKNLLKFKQFAKLYDQHRNQSLRDINSNLADILDQLPEV